MTTFATSTRVARALAAAVFAAAAMFAAASAQAAETQVQIDQFIFAPQRITVKAGTTVTWVNGDDIPHVIAEKDGKFRSGALDTDDSFSQSFATAGTVEYFCAIHPHMTGKIIVTP
jgi:plastocyanin